uniref:Glyceraldehyde-3-phosphate dehydrogenase Bic isoform X1 n=1 Tax=Rhizophora mucronata TaxID=61149 RepID=A0A2P2JS94_RHIMU
MATRCAKSTTLWLYPHSLSYQATTLTISSPMTMVNEESIVEETSLQRKSTDTRGSSQTSSIPFNGPSAAFLNAALTSSAEMPFFSTFTTRSTTDTLGVGTRKAMPLSLPFSWGSTRDTALAAPVLVGTMLRAAALALLRSRCEASSSLWIGWIRT